MLNASVHAPLSSSEVWNNYNLIGGVWLPPDSLHPGLVPDGSLLRGSTNLANCTMETFVQAPFVNPNPPPALFTSCLACHTTEKTETGTSPSLRIPAMNRNLSHVLTDGLVTREARLRRPRIKQHGP